MVCSSHLPWFEIFYKLLNQLAEIMNRTDHDSLLPLLKAFYKLPLPEVGELCDVITPDFKDVSKLGGLSHIEPESGSSWSKISSYFYETSGSTIFLGMCSPTVDFFAQLLLYSVYRNSLSMLRI